jgi:hypothetical protein
MEHRYVTKQQRRRNFGFVIACRLFRWDWKFTLERDIYCVSVTAGPLFLSVSY